MTSERADVAADVSNAGRRDSNAHNVCDAADDNCIAVTTH